MKVAKQPGLVNGLWIQVSIKTKLKNIDKTMKNTNENFFH
jgi:hypothetical protein